MAGQPKTRAATGRPAATGAAGYTRTHPPYEPGNLEAAKHGAWSNRLVAETVEELRPDLQRIVDQASWIMPLDAHALEDYLLDRARLTRLERWLGEHGDRYPAGHKRAGELRDRDLREVASLRRRCMDHRSCLGLNPAARARMDLERQQWDLAALWALEAGGDTETEAGSAG